MFRDLTSRDADNMDQACANFHYDPMGRKAQPKATYYNRHKNSWVCFTCAQGINREALQSHRRFSTPSTPAFKPVCIPGPEALVMLLQQNYG